jgi:hypothetical protein
MSGLDLAIDHVLICSQLRMTSYNLIHECIDRHRTARTKNLLLDLSLELRGERTAAPGLFPMPAP